MTKEQDLEKFTKIVVELSEEFTEKKGSITAEFSTSPDHLLEKIGILSKHNINTDDLGGYWFMFPCDTCKGYDEDRPIHVMIIDTKASSDYIAGGNLRRALKQNEALEKIIAEKDIALASGILVNPLDLKEVVNLALENEKEKCIHEKNETTLFLSNVIDEHFDQQDNDSELVVDEGICAKKKEIKRLDDIISQRKRELERVNDLFGAMVSVDIKSLQELPDGALDSVHGFVPSGLRAIKFIGDR
ncbi:hypothetical protein LMH73_021400 [Vibrio splendidus]|nr:hypothetical protein [Vibrio splendidus]MCC4880552.1 hypothetical protein [Vibrio splendidus]